MTRKRLLRDKKKYRRELKELKKIRRYLEDPNKRKYVLDENHSYVIELIKNKFKIEMKENGIAIINCKLRLRRIIKEERLECKYD